jgi:hypothetical protein
MSCLFLHFAGLITKLSLTQASTCITFAALLQKDTRLTTVYGSRGWVGLFALTMSACDLMGWEIYRKESGK